MRAVASAKASDVVGGFKLPRVSTGGSAQLTVMYPRNLPQTLEHRAFPG
jgi:hypothetical protein